MVSNEDSFTTSFHETECPSARVCGCGYQNAMGNPLEQPGNSGTLHKVIAIVVSAKWYFLVGGFNPSEKYQSNWKSFPTRGEHKKCLKAPPSISMCRHPTSLEYRGYPGSTSVPPSSDKKSFFSLVSPGHICRRC